jgi:hypothetical protein
MHSDSSSGESTPRNERLTDSEFVSKMSAGQHSLYFFSDVELFTKASANLYKYESGRSTYIDCFDKFFQIDQIKGIINDHKNVNDIKNLLDNHLSDKPELLNKFIDAIDNKAILSKLINESEIFTAPRTEVNQVVFEKLTNKIQSRSFCSMQ